MRLEGVGLGDGDMHGLHQFLGADRPWKKPDWNRFSAFNRNQMQAIGKMNWTLLAGYEKSKFEGLESIGFN